MHPTNQIHGRRRWRQSQSAHTAGGARLYLEQEKFLYENIKIYDQKSFKDNWKRFYR